MLSDIARSESIPVPQQEFFSILYDSGKFCRALLLSLRRVLAFRSIGRTIRVVPMHLPASGSRTDDIFVHEPAPGWTPMSERRSTRRRKRSRLYKTFPEAFKGLKRILVRKPNRVRTSNITQHIHTWLKQLTIYMKSFTGDREYFKGIGKIKFEGKESDNPLAFKY